MILTTVAIVGQMLLASGGKLKVIEPMESSFESENLFFEHPHVHEKKISHIKIPPAEAINMTEPRYFCTKPGFVLRGHKCILTEKLPVQHICPPGFERFDDSSKCFRNVPALFHCPKGVLKGEFCEVKHFSPVHKHCPEGWHETHGGKCRDTVPVELVPECRGDARLFHNKCVEYHYTQPEFLCPPGTIQEGKKCRQEEEVIVTDGKKRKLEGVEGVEGVEGEQGELQGEGESEGEERAVVAEGYDEEGAHGNKLKIKYAKVPVAVEKKIKIKTKEIKVKVPKEKVPKVKTVLKIKMFNAEKVCEKGVPSGKNCVEEHISHPEFVCPIKRIEGECVREKFISPILSCKEHDAHLRCDDIHKEERCRCEKIERFRAKPYCPDGGELEHEVCVFHADALETCPMGFKLDHLRHECVAVTIEDAECEFVVTYMCADCDKNRPEFKEIYFNK